MKKTTERKTLVLVSIGLFVIAASQIISHYIELNDLIKGSSIGVGIGLSLTAIVFGKLKTVHH